MVEGGEALVDVGGVVEDGGLVFNPGVGLEAAVLMANANTQVAWDALAAEQPPKGEGAVQAGGMEGGVAGGQEN